MLCRDESSADNFLCVVIVKISVCGKSSVEVFYKSKVRFLERRFALMRSSFM